MRVLVTGATGFIGNYVIGELINRGQEIIASSSNSEKATRANWFTRVFYKQYNIDQINDQQNLYAYFNQPDVLIHLAWRGLPDYKNLAHLTENFYPQFSFIKNLVSNGLKNVLVAGTCLEYGMQNGSLCESMLTMPSNPYAIAKDTLRKFLEEMRKEFDFNLNWMRLFYTYGKGQNPHSLFSLLEKAIRNNDKKFRMSGGEQLRDFLPIESIAEILVRIALQKKHYGIVNCCSGQPISVRSFVEGIAKNHHIFLELGCHPYPDYEPMEFWGDPTKMSNILAGIG